MSSEISSPGPRRRAWDPALQIVLLALFGVQVYLLVRDIPLTHRRDLPPARAAPGNLARPVIADLMEVHGDVSTRPPDNLLWTHGAAGAHLMQSEWLMTQENSRASIAFTDGVGIELGENTLVIVERVQPEGPAGGSALSVLPELEIRRGRVQKKALPNQAPNTPALRIRVGEAVATVPPDAEFTIETNGTGKTATIAVKKGAVTVLPAKGVAPVVIEAGKTLETGKPTVSQAPPPPPAPKKPRALPPPSRFLQPEIRTRPPNSQRALPNVLRLVSWLDRNFGGTPAQAAEPPPPIREIVLRWEKVKDAQGYVVQISRVSSFETLIVEGQTTTPEYAWAYSRGIENSRGRVFYRVASINPAGKQGPFSAPRPLPIPDALRLPPKPKVIVVKPEPPPPPRPPEKRFRLLAGVGYGDLSQTSQATDLRKVELKSPYARQLVRAEVRWPQYLLFADGEAATFKPATSPSFQKQVSGFRFRLDGYQRRGGNQTEWELRTGIETELDFRWIKSERLSVKPGPTPSAGPAIQIVRHWATSELGAGLAAPLTGLLYNAQYGLQADLWWEVSPIHAWSGVFLRLSAGAGWRKWGDPTGTQMTRWGVAIMPGGRL